MIISMFTDQLRTSKLGEIALGAQQPASIPVLSAVPPSSHSAPAPAQPSMHQSSSAPAQPRATQHGFSTVPKPTSTVISGLHALSQSSSTPAVSHLGPSLTLPKTVSGRPIGLNGTSVAQQVPTSTGSNSSSTVNGLIGLAMQITASQPQPIHTRSLKPASLQLSNSLGSSALGVSPASYSLPPPEQHASSLTIAPLNTQPPQHLPATAAQTEASEALLDLWDATPSGSSAPSGHSGTAYMHIPMLGSLPMHGLGNSALGHVSFLRCLRYAGACPYCTKADMHHALTCYFSDFMYLSAVHVPDSAHCICGCGARLHIVR